MCLYYGQSFYLLISQHVVDMTREDNLDHVSDKSDRSTVPTVQALSNKPEHTLRFLSLLSWSSF